MRTIGRAIRRHFAPMGQRPSTVIAALITTPPDECSVRLPRVGAAAALTVADGRCVGPAARKVDAARCLAHDPRAVRHRRLGRRSAHLARLHAERDALGRGALVVPGRAHEHARLLALEPSPAHVRKRPRRLGDSPLPQRPQRVCPLGIARRPAAEAAGHARTRRQRLGDRGERARGTLRRRACGEPVERLEQRVERAPIVAREPRELGTRVVRLALAQPLLECKERHLTAERALAGGHRRHVDARAALGDGDALPRCPLFRAALTAAAEEPACRAPPRHEAPWAAARLC
eukprot:1505521-Prymnesium_polylepis.4